MKKEEYTSITTQERYDFIASRLEQLQNAAPGSAAAKELKLLTKLLVEFEEANLQSNPNHSKRF
ncbi:hypothetical protein [Pontibacter chitinilyticus]|uniref:hypothetical protein n=1 Tax=Pontibacter chitinilyticus TaxID=2674989 RepID=UPI00321C0B56